MTIFCFLYVVLTASFPVSLLVTYYWLLWGLFSFSSIYSPHRSFPCFVSGGEVPYYLLVCLRFFFFSFPPSLPVLYLMSKLSKNRYVHHPTKCCIFSRSEASVIVRGACLADGAIAARTDSTTCKSWLLMAAVLVTVIPLGQWMEILPVTKIQASASAKQMLLVCVMQKFTVTSLLPLE